METTGSGELQIWQSEQVQQEHCGNTQDHGLAHHRKSLVALDVGLDGWAESRSIGLECRRVNQYQGQKRHNLHLITTCASEA
jgi:hypothetical protein